MATAPLAIMLFSAPLPFTSGVGAGGQVTHAVTHAVMLFPSSSSLKSEAIKRLCASFSARRRVPLSHLKVWELVLPEGLNESARDT